MANIKWEGIEILSGIIKEAGSRIENELSIVIKDNTSDLNESMQKLAPVDTGDLRRGIKSTFPNKLESHTSSDMEYQAYQEYGTRFQPGKPHVRPALKEIEPKFKADLTKVMKGVFDK